MTYPEARSLSRWWDSNTLSIHIDIIFLNTKRTMKVIELKNSLQFLLLILLILSYASFGSGFQHMLPNTRRVQHTAGLSRQNLLLRNQRRNESLFLHALDNEAMMDDSFTLLHYNRHPVATRRTWCRNVLITTISVATIAVGAGEEPSTAIESSSPESSTEIVDPLVTFGESLSSKSSDSSSVNSIRPISSSSWPDNAAHPLPTLATDPIPTTAEMEESSSQPPSPPPLALEQVLQQSKSKKQINPTTHG